MKIVLFKGGLGNQLFQLCLYLELINTYKEKIYIDSKTGFFWDFKYKRKFELERSIQNETISSNSQIILNTIFLFLKKYFNIFFYLINFEVIGDQDYFFKSKKLIFNSQRQHLLFNGYFQNFQVVDKNLSKLIKYIEPYLQKRVNKRFENLYAKIKSEKNSVALCIRFYEETNNPKAHAKDGIQLSPNEFNKVIRELENKLNDPHFFVFVQNRNEFLDQIKINSKFTIVSHDNYYLGSWERLRAQSYCKHHIFNNSTFYFWGAILSNYYNADKNFNQKIYVSHNFIFKEIYNPKWKIF